MAAANSSATVKVLVHKDNKVVQELSVPALKRISIGRREDADWIIEHPSGSRQHACIELDTSGLYVTDLGSAHGTTKNGERLPAQKKVLLKSGDALMFGGSTRKYVIVMSVVPRQDAGPVPTPSQAKPAAVFNPWAGGRGAAGGGGLNSSGNLSSVLSMLEDQKRDKRTRDDDNDAGVVGKYVKKQSALSGGGGLEGMARRLEDERRR